MKTTKLFLKIYSRRAVRLCCCCCLLLLFAGCEKEEEGKQDEPKSAECELVLFTVNGTPWAINGASIACTYPEGTTATPLTPIIVVSNGASVSPASGAAQNFFTAQGVTYVVTAEDGTTKKTYTAKATIADTPDTPDAACDITAFTVNSTAWDISGATITYNYPEGTAATTLTPVITVSPGATVTPASGMAQNFFTGAGVTYVVTAKDGTTTKTYTAKATVAPSSTCDITAFTVSGTAWNISGTTITYIYPEETTATTLTPVITVSPGATVTPASGVAQNFFTGAGVTYTVTAADGVTTKTYTAKATIMPSGVCDITAFTVNSTPWSISGATITYTYPEGTIATMLTPAITVSPGATVTPASGVAQNFFTTAGVTYTVTAGGGAMKKTYVAKAVTQSAAYGVTGDCMWTLTGASPNYTLTISGNGAMGSYTYYGNVPWYSYRTDIKTVVIQGGVTTIGNYAFSGCTGLTGTLTIPNSVTTIGDYAFSGCTGLTGTLTIPNSVTTIGSSAFSGCYGLNSLTIPNSVTTIGKYAFYDCDGLTGALNIPNSVTTIGEYAFSSCSGLTSLTLGNSVTTIGKEAFYGCSGLTGTLTIPNSVTTIGNEAFRGCSGLTGTLTIPNSVTTIGNSAFSGCSGFTGALTIPNSVTTIGYYAFDGCSGFTGTLTLGNSITSIGQGAYSSFDGCSGMTAIIVDPANPAFSAVDGVLLNKQKTTLILCPQGKTGSYTIPNTVTTIGEYAFYYCRSLTSVTIGNSVTTIGSHAFYYCDGLTSVTLGNTVTTIGSYAFYGGYGSQLTTVTNHSTTPQSITGNTFYSYSNCTLRVPSSAVEAYRAANYWKNFGTITGF